MNSVSVLGCDPNCAGACTYNPTTNSAVCAQCNAYFAATPSGTCLRESFLFIRTLLSPDLVFNLEYDLLSRNLLHVADILLFLFDIVPLQSYFDLSRNYRWFAFLPQSSRTIHWLSAFIRKLYLLPAMLFKTLSLFHSPSNRYSLLAYHHICLYLCLQAQPLQLLVSSFIHSFN